MKQKVGSVTHFNLMSSNKQIIVGYWKDWYIYLAIDVNQYGFGYYMQSEKKEDGTLDEQSIVL